MCLLDSLIFKTDMFPSPVAEMVAATARATETPVELAGLMALAVVSTCTQQKIQIMGEPGYYEPLNIWALPALDSGNRKSAVVKKMTDPLLDWELDKSNELKPQIQQLEDQRENKIARLKTLRNQYAKDDGANIQEIEAEILKVSNSIPDIPALPRLWVQDITPEKLGDVMAEQGEKISILSAEGGIFDIIGGRYNQNIPNLDIYLQAHAGDPVRVDRHSRDSVFMRNPALSMGLSPQPDVLQGLSEKPGFRGRGLLARFLYAMPTSPIGSRKLNTVPVPDHITSRYHLSLKALLDITPNVDENGIIKPYTLNLNDDAHNEWKEFSREVERGMAPGGQYENITDWAAKLPGAALRIAGNFHCIENINSPWEHPITRDTMEKSLILSAILSQHALLVFGYMGADKSIAAAKKVWGCIERNRKITFTARDCFQALKGTYRRMDELTPALKVLMERCYIFKNEKEDRPGRPSLSFTVNHKLSEGWL